MEISDRTVKCATCGREFLFTAKEQEFFVGKGFKEPRHCRECRQQRKHERDEAIAQATGQPLAPGREMFKVICANCRRDTVVPFKPITGKPVLCKDCFIAQRYGSAGQPHESQPLSNGIPFISVVTDVRLKGGTSIPASQVAMNSDSVLADNNGHSVAELSFEEAEQ